jgi:hypothetical protein
MYKSPIGPGGKYTFVASSRTAEAFLKKSLNLLSLRLTLQSSSELRENFLCIGPSNATLAKSPICRSLCGLRR